MPLRAGVSENSGPARSRRKPLRLKREHGAYRRRCFRSRGTARELAAARRVRRSNARGVRAVQMSQRIRCQRLWPAFTSRNEWRPPEAGGWDRQGRQRALLHAARQATEKCARRRQVRNDRAMAVLDDYLPSSDLLHVCLTTCCGCAVSVTALADVVKRAGGRCLMARYRRAPWRDVLDDMESESTYYSRT